MGIPRLDLSLPTLAVTCLLSLGAAAQSNFGSVNLGGSKIESVTVTMTASGSLSKISVRTMGAEDLDFTNAGGGTCAAGTEYAVKSFCTVRAEFKPGLAGLRRGAVVLLDSKGDVLGADYLQGVGEGPQAILLTGTGVATGLPAARGEADETGLAVDGAETIWTSGALAPGYFGQIPLVPWMSSGDTYTEQPAIDTYVPGGIAVDGAGFVDSANHYNNPSQFRMSGSKLVDTVNCTSSLGAFYGDSIATDGAGNAFSFNEDSVQTSVSFASGSCNFLNDVHNLSCSGVLCNYWSDLTLDPSGDFIYSSAGSSEGFKIFNGFNAISLPLTSPEEPVSDGVGNLYVADGDPANGQKGTQSTYFAARQPDGTYKLYAVAGKHIGPLALDGNGNLFTDGGAYEFRLLNPSPISFGKTSVGQTGSRRRVTVVNAGNAKLRISSVLYPKDFPEAKGILGDCAAGQTVPAGGFCTITVVFSPTAPLDGAKSLKLSGEIKLVSSSLGGYLAEQTIPVTGTETLPVPVVSLKTSANPSPTGHALALTATVEGGSGRPAPTGEVAFVDGKTILGRAALKGGNAAFSISTLAAGTHMLAVAYGGDSNYAAAESRTIDEIVGKAAPKVSIVSSANPAVVGAAITFTATVSGVSGAAAPGGIVTFYNGTASMGTAMLSGGKAKLSTSKLAAGNHSILAAYGGDALYKAAVGSPLTETVNPK